MSLGGQVNCRLILLKALGIIEKDYESEGQRPSGKAASYALSFDKDIFLKTDEIQLSTAPWASHKIIKSKKLSGLNYKDFKDSERNITEHITGLFEKEKSLDKDRITQIDNFVMLANTHICSELGDDLIDEADYYQLVAIYKKVPKKGTTKKNNDDKKKPANNNFLNSFFIEDLAKTITFTQKGKTNDLLFQYLDMREQEKIDVRTKLKYVDKILCPDSLPDGCWPAKGGYPLVYSQQFAINSIQERLLKNKGFYAINGPPGTGKTTLLRDLIAMVVTERAKLIATLDRPDNIFQSGMKNTIKKGDGTTSAYFPLNDNLLGHDIVVASSNNGAVENVTKEIPSIDGIDQAWLKDIDFFADTGSALIGETAWGSLAAPLGNSANKRNFVQKFFWSNEWKDKNNNEITYTAMAEYLRTVKELSEAERIKQWEAAKEAFEQSLSDVAQYKLQKNNLLKKYNKAQKQLNEFETQLKQLSKLLNTNQNKQATFWVKLLEKLIPFRKTYEQEVKEKSDYYKLEIARTRNNISDYQKKYDDAHHVYFEAKENPTTDKEKEESCPWTNDEDFQKARAQVFINALNLHKATIDVNAKKLRANPKSYDGGA